MLLGLGEAILGAVRAGASLVSMLDISRGLHFTSHASSLRGSLMLLSTPRLNLLSDESDSSKVAESTL